MSYVAERISLGKLLGNFAIVYAANFVGADMVGLVYHTIYRRRGNSSVPSSTPEKP